MLSRNLPIHKKDRSFEPWFSLQEEVRDLFDRFSNDLIPRSDADFVPRVDVKDRGDSYLVTAEIPGMTEKDINITFEENGLVLEGEKKNEFKDEGKGFWKSEISYGSFYRRIPLSADVDEEKVSASYKNGILLVTLNKRPEAKSKARKITINKGTIDTTGAVAKH